MNRTCSSCNQTYPRTSEYFYKNSHAADGLYSVCKPCKKAYKRSRRQAYRKSIKQEIRDYKAITPCVDCKQNYPFFVMEFDHLPGVDKRKCIAELLRDAVGRDALATEIAKCELVCVNCHRIRTYTRRFRTSEPKPDSSLQ